MTVPGSPVVIIGGGTAGSVVAHTLASMVDIPLVVIEPGPLTDDDAPRFLDGLTDDVLWHGLPMPQARALGGGSAVNGLILSGPVPPWLEGLTHVATEDETGSVGRSFLSAGGKLSRLWWNNGRWNPARAVLHLAEEGRLRLVRAEAGRINVKGDSAVSVQAGAEEIGCSHVVVCAGALLTPRLLLRSGIGGNVGTGLQNHPTVTFGFDRRDGNTGVFDATVIRHVEAGRAKGLMVAYERASAGDDGSAMVTVSLMNPVSRGSVTAESIDFGLLSDPRDAAAMEAILGAARDVMRRAGWESWEESAVHAVSHASSSCARSVDAFGRVQGFANITVADASVLPWVPEDTPAASVTMVARRIATALGEVIR